MRRALAGLGSLTLLLGGVASAQVAPFQSFHQLVSSNGYAALVFDAEARKVVSFRENLYRYPAPGQETKELAYDLYLGLRAGGHSAWLNTVPLDSAGYEAGTGLIATVQHSGDLLLRTTYLAPFGVSARGFLVLAELENRGATLNDVALFSLHNFHLGGGAGQTSAEHIVWDAAHGAYLESSAAAGAPAGLLVVKPIGAITHHAASPMNPYPLVTQNQHLGDLDDSGVIDDAVSGFELVVNGGGPFAAGAKASFGLWVGYAPDRDAAGLIAAVDGWIAGRSPTALLDAERSGWHDWQHAGRWPATRSAAESQVALQSLAVLRMAQVRESGAPNGQIVASLPLGHWDLAWLRDGLFACQALSETGHHAEVGAALDFFLRGPSNGFQTELGRPYALSVARYFGNAAEDSDSNQNGPNIELDGFGLFLAEAARHVEASGDLAWFDRNKSTIDDRVADVLVGFRDPVTQLIAADSSIWESHWSNGGRQRWAFTSGAAVVGLRAWATLLEAHAGGTPDPHVATYRAAASAIAAGIQTALIDPLSGALAASVEQLGDGSGRFADAQTALVLMLGALDGTSSTAIATLDFLKSRLFLSSTGHGYKRNDDGDAYDEREWAVIDLGISRAARRAGRGAEADALLDWITQLAALNLLVVPELLDQATAAYVGEIPMAGFGAGAYLSALIDRGGTVSPDPSDGGSPPNDGGSSASDGPLPSADGAGLDGGPDTEAGPGDGASADDRGTLTQPDAGRVLQSESDCKCTHSFESQGSGWGPLALLALGWITRRRFRRRARAKPLS